MENGGNVEVELLINIPPSRIQRTKKISRMTATRSKSCRKTPVDGTCSSQVEELSTTGAH